MASDISLLNKLLYGGDATINADLNYIDKLKATLENNPPPNVFGAIGGIGRSPAGIEPAAKQQQAVSPAPSPENQESKDKIVSRLNELRALAKTKQPQKASQTTPQVSTTTTTSPFSRNVSKSAVSEKDETARTDTQKNISDTSQKQQSDILVKFNQQILHPHFAALYGAATGEPGLIEYLGTVEGEPQYRITQKGMEYSLRDLPEIRALENEAKNYEAIRDIYKDTALTGFGNVDIRPLLAYIDATTGSNLAASYTPPKNETDAILAMSRDIFKQRSDAAKRLTDIMRGASTMSFSQAVADKMLEAIGNKAITGAQTSTKRVVGKSSEDLKEAGTKPLSGGSGRGPEERFIAEIKTDPGLKEYRKSLELIHTLSDNMESVDLYPILNQTIKALAKMYDDRLSETDIAIAKRFDPAWGARLERWSREGGLASGKEPPLPPRDKAILMQAIMAMRGALEDRVKNYVTNRAKNSTAYGIPYERGLEIFYNQMGVDPQKMLGKRNMPEAIKRIYPQKDRYDRKVEKYLPPSNEPKKESALERLRKKMLEGE